MDYKYKEIKDYFNDFLIENSTALNDKDFIDELHHNIFNRKSGRIFN